MSNMAMDEDPQRGTATDPGESRSSSVRRIAVALSGVVVILIGIPMIPLFGPGWLVVFTGLAILASEFEWADRLRNRMRHRVRSFLDKRTPGSGA